MKKMRLRKEKQIQRQRKQYKKYKKIKGQIKVPKSKFLKSSKKKKKRSQNWGGDWRRNYQRNNPGKSPTPEVREVPNRKNRADQDVQTFGVLGHTLNTQTLTKTDEHKKKGFK